MGQQPEPLSVFCRPDGTVEHVYDDGTPTTGLGLARISRASNVEPNFFTPTWYVDLSPTTGKAEFLGAYPTRTEALEAERLWLLNHLRSGTATPASPRA
jgi:hypothetical protein